MKRRTLELVEGWKREIGARAAKGAGYGRVVFVCVLLVEHSRIALIFSGITSMWGFIGALFSLSILLYLSSGIYALAFASNAIFSPFLAMLQCKRKARP